MKERKKEKDGKIDKEKENKQSFVLNKNNTTRRLQHGTEFQTQVEKRGNKRKEQS